jgi:hypothetical protein
VLVVEVPGHWTTRVNLERAIRERGWHRALSPADADVLLVCGVPGAELAAAVDRVWEQMPGPRVRFDVLDAADAEAALDRARDALLDASSLREDARTRTTEPDMDHGDMDHGDMDHGDMDHGDMDMSPGGIALAGGGEDRDGLEMDVLHLPLGPVLPAWPAGLVLRTTLQGDVIVAAEVEQLQAAPSNEPSTQPTSPRPLTAAVRLDNAARLLALAGWQAAASQAERVRDAAMAGESTDRVRDDAVALLRRVARSRMLRWSLRRVRPVDDSDLADHAWPSWWAGDVHDRLLAGLDRAVSVLSDGESPEEWTRPDEEPAPDLSAALPELVTGLDLATARLVVASLDLDPAGVPEAARA